MSHPEVLYVPDLARLLGRTDAAVRTAVNRGASWLPPPFPMGHRLAWRRADVEAWLAKQAREVRR